VSQPQWRGPIEFRTEPPQDKENPWVLWTLRGLGLVAVAVISGLVWWYINEEKQPAQPAASSQTTQQRTGQYEFAPAPQVPTPS
jgi:hypothetical protein